MYSPEGIFPLGITYSFQPVTKFHSDFNNPDGKPPARVRAILADCRSETEGILINITGQEKLHKRKACNTFSSLER